jgi:hypothetical protein
MPISSASRPQGQRLIANAMIVAVGPDVADNLGTDFIS